jgi:protein-tyrosine-phosphatase
MDRDSAIKKIKKCLALAGSSNPHEAASAMRQAQKLMQEHGVSETDVSLADVSEKGTKAPSNTVSVWQSKLARSVAEAFGCELYYCRHVKLVFNRAQRSTDVVFIGVGAAAEVASYAFDVLLRQAIRDRATHIAAQSKKLKQRTKTARGDAFALAWVVAVQEQLDKFVGNPASADLVVTYMQQNHADLGQFTPAARHLNRHVHDDSYTSGHSAGKKARLERGVAGGQAQQLIEG